MTSDDLRLVAGWMDQPHWRQWWGEPDGELDQIREMIAGKDTSRPFVFLDGGRPVGYIQYWFVGHFQNRSWIDAHPWLNEFPEDAVGVDLSVGDETDLGRGYGSAALALFAGRLFRLGYETIIIDPDPENARAMAAYEKAGFMTVDRLAGKTGDTHLMQFETRRFSQ